MIFITVVIGIASLGNVARAGGLALRALGYFLVMTVIALTLGLLAGNIIQPGSGFEGQPTAEGQADAKESIGEVGGDQGLVSGGPARCSCWSCSARWRAWPASTSSASSG